MFKRSQIYYNVYLCIVHVFQVIAGNDEGRDARQPRDIISVPYSKLVSYFYLKVHILLFVRYGPCWYYMYL